MSQTVLKSLLAMLFALGTSSALAQMPNPYGAPIGLESAKKAVAAAEAEARKNNWKMAFAVTDISGDLVYLEKMDATQTGSVAVAIGKARSAALFKRPTKVFQDAVAGGGAGLRILGLEGAVPLDGGFPIVMDGKIVGAIGASGATRSEEHTSELQSRFDLVCRLLLEKKKLVNTGATYSLLPEQVWQAIGLAPKRAMEFVLADGTSVRRPVSECHIPLHQRVGHHAVVR